MNIWAKALSSLTILAVAILIGMIMLFGNVPSVAVIAFLGVLLGGLISGFVQYSMSEANRKQQLRLAALDKRLQTAQEAYKLWMRLRRLPRYDEPDDGVPIEKILRDCLDWWETHSLFLSAEARMAFYKAWNAARDLAAYRDSHPNRKDLKIRYEEIDQAGRVIEESVFLPSIGELESTRYDKGLLPKDDVPKYLDSSMSHLSPDEMEDYILWRQKAIAWGRRGKSAVDWKNKNLREEIAKSIRLKLATETNEFEIKKAFELRN